MSRIETSLALPVFHDRVPVRGTAGDFLGRLQVTEAPGIEARDGQPLPTDRPAVKPQQQRAADRVGPTAELYALAALPLHHLSYRALHQAAAGDAAAQTGAAAVASASPDEPAAIVAAVAETADAPARTADADASLPVRPSIASSGDEDGATASATAEARERLAADWLRRLRRYEVPGGVELVLRDYEGAHGGDPLPALLDYCRHQEIPVVRIVLNGHVVWSRNQPGQG